MESGAMSCQMRATDFLPVIPRDRREKQETRTPDISFFDPLATPNKVKRRSVNTTRTILGTNQRPAKSRSLEIKVFVTDEDKNQNKSILESAPTVQSGRFTIRTQKLPVLTEGELPIEEDDEEHQIYENHKNQLNESLERFYREILA